MIMAEKLDRGGRVQSHGAVSQNVPAKHICRLEMTRKDSEWSARPFAYSGKLPK
jgi:hypothetical protein